MDMFTSLFISLPIADMTGAFMDSTMPGKIIVMALFIGSAWAWTIMVTKGSQLRLASNATEAFLERFREERDPITLFTNQESFYGTPLDVIYKSSCTALAIELQAQEEARSELMHSDGVPNCQLTRSQIQTLQAVVDRNVADEALNLEDQMGLLATAVSAAPFLGLLGTVWGVMDAFAGMASSGSAALSAVAPGISGALLTTIIGLLVALPSMVGYNLLSGKIRRISVQMDNFAQEYVSAIQNSYVIGG